MFIGLLARRLEAVSAAGGDGGSGAFAMRKNLDVGDVAVDPVRLDGLDWAELFGDAHPVEVEIGTGKAGFLLRRARAHPEINFLGIEWANKFYKFAADRFRRWGVGNVRMVRTDASHFIRVQCPRESLSVLHVYHPDPWPKKRHHRRRLFQKPFVEAAAARLVPGGRIAVQTDHAEYFEQIREVLLAHPDLSETEFNNAEFGVEAEGSIATNFEIKYLREGREMYQVAVVRGAE